MADNTGQKQRRRGPGKPFKPGQSGNPAGRPKGSRNKLSESFTASLLNDFEVHGSAVIATVRENDPSAYLRIIATLLPKNIDVSESGVPDQLTDEELDARIRELLVVTGYDKSITH